jgi:hypothetical protein
MVLDGVVEVTRIAGSFDLDEGGEEHHAKSFHIERISRRVAANAR